MGRSRVVMLTLTRGEMDLVIGGLETLQGDAIRSADTAERGETAGSALVTKVRLIASKAADLREKLIRV